VRGLWKYDASRKSRVDLYGSILVNDAFGALPSDWNKVQPGVDSIGVERHWGKIVMNSASDYPYFKQ
jgi:hypothetical protein